MQKIRWTATHFPVSKSFAFSASLFALFTLTLAVLALFGHEARVVKSSDLVFSSAYHALLGYAVSILMWVTGTAAVLPFLRSSADRFPAAALAGFIVSLPITAIFVILSLIFSGTVLWLSAIVLIFNVVSFVLVPLTLRELQFVVRCCTGLLPFSMFFGVWLGLDLHGPTETEPGPTIGDLTFYASAIWSLELQAWPLRNLGALNEVYVPPWNQLWSAVGAILLRHLGIEPHLFLASGGGSAYILNVGIAISLFFYNSSRQLSGLAVVALILAGISASWHPSWTVGSIPVIHAVPLALAATYWLVHRPSMLVPTIFLTFAALIGTALSKVTMALFVVAIAFFSIVPRMQELSKRQLFVIMVVGAVACLYGAWMLNSYLWFYIHKLGPETYLHNLNGLPFWPMGVLYLLREAGYATCGVLAVRLLPLRISLALAVALAAGLIYPWIFRIDAIVALLVAVLLIVRQSQANSLQLILLAVALALAAPASLFGDYVGGNLWLVWPIAISGLTLVALASRKPDFRAYERSPKLLWPWISVTFCFCVTLVFIATGHLAVTNRERVEQAELTPMVRDIWQSVREKTPKNALIFTDQVSEKFSLVGGYNTYAFAGQRQIYLSNIWGTLALTRDVDQRRNILRLNRSILSGQTHPVELADTSKYSTFFAVVDNSRIVPMGWHLVHRNSVYALYRIESKPPS